MYRVNSQVDARDRGLKKESDKLHLRKLSSQPKISTTRAYPQPDVCLVPSPRRNVQYRQIVHQQGDGHDILLTRVNFNIGEPFEYSLEDGGKLTELRDRSVAQFRVRLLSNAGNTTHRRHKYC
jgi:hypothetical protein